MRTCPMATPAGHWVGVVRDTEVTVTALMSGLVATREHGVYSRKVRFEFNT